MEDNIYKLCLITRMHEEFLEFNSKKANHSVKTWVKYLNRHFKEDTQFANKHMKGS